MWGGTTQGWYAPTELGDASCDFYMPADPALPAPRGGSPAAHPDRRLCQVDVGHHQLLALGQLALVVLPVGGKQLGRHLKWRRVSG